MGVFSEKREGRKIADIKKRIESLSDRVSDMEVKISLAIKNVDTSNLGGCVTSSSLKHSKIKSL